MGQHSILWFRLRELLILFYSCIFQPLYGQLADLWGRRWPLISSVVIFMVGSAICGAAPNTGALIAGRAVQGIGGGGINTLVEIVVCDLVPLADRGYFTGIIFVCISVSAAVGPVIGGALTSAGAWRWVFYLNLPVGAIPLIILVLTLKTSSRGDLSWKQRVRRIDGVGNLIFVIGTVLVIYVLTYAGTKYPWSDPQMIALIVVGFFILGVFALYESSRWCAYPVVPPRLFGNRTSAAVYFITFNQALLITWSTYFFPVYFQTAFGASPEGSGVNFLPFVIAFPLFAAIGGIALGVFGQFQITHLVALIAVTVGFGSSSILTETSSTATWVILQIVISAGLGLLMPVLLPAIQSHLTEKDVATSTGLFTFLRSFANIWGITIPSSVFNNQAESQLWQVNNATIQAELSNGQAYDHATAAFINSISSSDTRAEVVSVYVQALRLVWFVGLAFAAASLLMVAAEKRVALRRELETDFGLQAEPKAKDPESGEEKHAA